MCGVALMKSIRFYHWRVSPRLILLKQMEEFSLLPSKHLPFVVNQGCSSCRCAFFLVMRKLVAMGGCKLVGCDKEVKSHILFGRFWYHYWLIWYHYNHSYGIIIMVLANVVSL